MALATPEDYHNTFAVSTTGRRVIKDMMQAHYFHTSTFDPDPLVLAMREGERNAVLRILTILHEREEELKK